MLLALLHGGWDTIIAALLFWTWPFIVLGILITSIIRKRKARQHQL